MRRTGERTAIRIFALSGIIAALVGASFLLKAPTTGAEKSSAVSITVKSAQELLHTLNSKKKQLIAHGGTILLETGDYGAVDIRDIAPAKRIRIAAAEGATPEFLHIRVLNAEKITLDGLSVVAVRPSHERYAGQWRRHLLEVLGCKEVHLLNMYVASARDTSKWSKEEWLENVLNGAFIRDSSYTVVKDSLFENVFDGMTDFHGSDNLFEDNTVREFAGDGIRAIGQHGTFKGNHVTDCIKVNENHDDGIQSWAYGPNGRPGKGELVGLKILNNRIELGQTPHPLRCPHMQGLGFFDGFWRDLVIDGNTIIVDHWHGIAVGGARDSVIRNNVVQYRQSPAKELIHKGPKKTWIKVGPHKDGRPSERVVVENNEAAHFEIVGKDMVSRNNRHN